MYKPDMERTIFEEMLNRNCSELQILTLSSDPSYHMLYKDLCNSSDDNQTSNYSLPVEFYMTRSQVITELLGPRMSPFFLPVLAIYLPIFVTGVVGNFLTCIVISRHRLMRTPTNFYLFSLAVSDLLVLVLGMPLELYEMWENYPSLFGEGGCYFKTMLFETVCFASVLNVTALSVERYIAVVHPLKARWLVTRTHARRVIACLWVASVCCSVPNTSLHGIHYLRSPLGEPYEESTICIVTQPRWIYNVVVQITALLFFLVPMATISVLYLLIGRQLRREKSMAVPDECEGRGAFGNQRIRTNRSKCRQVTKMLYVLVIVFGICWAPFHTDRLVWSFVHRWTEDSHGMFQCVHLVSGVFFYLSSVVNPVIYNLLSTRFRDMFREVMCRRRAPRDPRRFAARDVPWATGEAARGRSATTATTTATTTAVAAAACVEVAGKIDAKGFSCSSGGGGTRDEAETSFN
ncbi:neuromedin-U receptor 1-like [Lampetra fluviatilis]